MKHRALQLTFLTVPGLLGLATADQDEPAWKQACQPKQDAIGECLATELTISETNTCVQCLETEMQAHLERETDCLTAEHELCESILDCSSVCGDCTVHTEEMFKCVWEETVPMCPELDCDTPSDQYQESPSTSTESASSSTPNEPAWKQACRPEEQEMEQCLATDLTLSEAESCIQCLENELQAHQDRAADCLTAEHELCESILDCNAVCGECSGYTEEMFKCVWDESVPVCPDLVCDQVMIQYQQKVKVHNILYFVVLGLVVAGVAARVIVGRRSEHDVSVDREGYVAGREYDLPVIQTEPDIV